MKGDPERGCGLAVRRPEGSLTISPGEGTEGSLSWRFMSTVERRRPVFGECWFREMELLDDPVEC